MQYASFMESRQEEPEHLIARRAQREIHHLAARGMSALVGVLGAFLLLASAGSCAALLRKDHACWGIALMLAAVHVTILLCLYGLHVRHGALSDPPGRSPLVLLISQPLLMVAGLLAGVVLARLFASTLQRALQEGHRVSALLRIGADWTSGVGLMMQVSG